MKTKLSLLMIAMLFIGITASAQKAKIETFKVYGNCGMCESRIEKAAKSVDGVSMADWNKKTKMIKVSFDVKKTNVHKIHMAIAKVGHDTNMHKADDKVYNKLHGCCQYDRAKAKKKKIQKHKH